MLEIIARIGLGLASAALLYRVWDAWRTARTAEAAQHRLRQSWQGESELEQLRRPWRGLRAQGE